MYNWEKHIDALMALILCLILLGAFGFQVFEHEEPCPLCYLQRLAMLGVAGGVLMNLRLGIHKAHYGLSLIFAIFGSFVSLRQISLHICPQFPTFGMPFLGLSLYVWAFITFVASITYIALILLIFDKNRNTKDHKPFHPFHGIVFWFAVLIALANVVSTVLQCGFFGPCEG